MASSSSPKANEVEEYESDPEDTPLPSMRRREAASDDEENTDGDRSDSAPSRKLIVASDEESDYAGAPEDYDHNDGNDHHDNNDLDGEDEEYYDEIEEEEEIGDEIEDEEEIGEEEEEGIEEVGHAGAAPEITGEGGAHDDGQGNKEEDKEHGDQRVEELENSEKKENEPCAVPTAGAFYMHDDRFRNNGRGRHRRFPGGRKLWESKDDQAWVHDRFEELNLQDSHRDEERRSSRGRFRGRGGSKARAGGWGYTRGNRPRAYDDNDNQNRTQRSARGRGPRRYETLQKNRHKAPAHSNKQYLEQQETLSSSGNNGRPSGQLKQPSNVQDMQMEPARPRKLAFSSSLNSASPPFYPSGSSNQDTSATQKKDVHGEITNRLRSSAFPVEERIPARQTGPLQKGRLTYDSAGHDRLYGDETFRPVAGKAFSNSLLQTPVSSLASVNAQSTSRMTGRGVPAHGPRGQPSVTLNQVPRASSNPLSDAAQPRPFQSRVQPLRTSAPTTGHRHGNSPQAAQQILPANSSEVGDREAPTGSSKSKTTPVGKGQVTGQGTGKGSFFYGGSHVIGNAGSMAFTPGEQGFPGTAALLPVMQIRGQHGVPMGMAVQGYVAQPQLGFGNSEGPWLPLLASTAAGALGPSIPYLTLDGNYYPRPSGQTSSASSSTETNSEKSSSMVQPPPNSEIVKDDFGHRQSKPRRYSEMNFGQ